MCRIAVGVVLFSLATVLFVQRVSPDLPAWRSALYMAAGMQFIAQCALWCVLNHQLCVVARRMSRSFRHEVTTSSQTAYTQTSLNYCKIITGIFQIF